MPEEPIHVTNQRFYDRISKIYDSIANANEHTAREHGESLLKLQPGERVLEIGFGTGNSLVGFARAVAPYGQVCGVDVSSGMCDVARSKLEAAGLEDLVDFHVGDAIALDWPDDSLDAVFMSFALELFEEEDIARVLQECRRVLKSTGRLGIVGMATVAKGDQASALEKTYTWIHRHFPHIVDCRPIDFDSELNRNGFDVVQEDRMEIWTMPVAAVIAK